jgi:chromosomal replication initiation ATPase DnaA
MIHNPQLALAFVHVRRPRVGAFLRAPSNEDAIIWLERSSVWPHRRLAIWGEEGCGKTHLLADWAARTGARTLHGTQLPEFWEKPESAQGGLAIDDADDVRAEATLLHLLNIAAEARLPVLLAARIPPARWRVQLPDLASRLRAITAVRIGAPDEALLRVVLTRLFLERGHRVAQSTQDWLLTHLPRSPGTLRLAADRLDYASVARPGGITLPFARQVLADMLRPTGESPSASPLCNEDSMSSGPGSPPLGTLL